ncbi:MAG TPA: GMC family oxidoreductase [Candidatus Saccharimonadales bacterium]|nr:GMC family oxidoreductase [Candidatus Saccharimonadales bacterium]
MKQKIAVIGGGISATTFLRYLFSNSKEDSFTIFLFETGQVELVDHVRNLSVSLRDDIVRRHAHITWSGGFQKGYMLKMLGGKAMIGASHFCRFYPEDFAIDSLATWPEGVRDLSKVYSDILGRNSWTFEPAELFGSLKRIVGDDSFRPMQMSCDSQGGKPTPRISYSPVRDIFRMKAHNNENFNLLTGSQVVSIAKRSSSPGYAVAYLDLATKERRSQEVDIIVLAANTIESTRILFNSPDIHLNGRYFGRYLSEHGCQKWYFETKSLKDNPNEEFCALIPPKSKSSQDRFHVELKFSKEKDGIRQVVMTGHTAMDSLENNRIEPSRLVDEMGVPKVEIFYKASAADTERVRTMEAKLREIVKKLQGRRLVIKPSGEGGSYHESCTIRMAEDAERGCVDVYGKIFGEDGVFILGSSTFPYIGVANPALTMMALSARTGMFIAENY